MHRFCCWLVMYAGLILNSAVATEPIAVVDIPIEMSVLDDYRRFVGTSSVYDIQSFDHAGTRRDVVDMVLVQQALHLGGYPLQFNFIPSDSSARSTQLFVRGDVLISLDSVWGQTANNLKSHVYISSAVIDRGDYVAAIFTSPNNQKTKSIRQLSDFSGLTAVSSRAYAQDWQLLEQLPLRELRDEYNWSSMAMLVSRGWVDFMLAPFPQHRPFGYRAPGIELVAVEGVKVLLDDSRHFIVAKKHPLAAPAFAALQRGLAILRQQGKLTRAYQECGFFNPEISHWTVLRPAATNASVAKQQQALTGL
ncbi:hypothetical protein EOE67_08780 [Rheinheimera riviphila]|uniref:Transporter substrate-binding domain-containing protein n=1 Tax=Rheinheimera riviphila TaxID=1834037 RepID=A0A437QZU1_9GAMM|nr:hypothetical protein [Rheinheimera riviphila]RVU39991.1 hypothetical protein EOE67_08780 [Rheinheimera riviphila]